jgi:hypothetical protein
VLVVPLGTRLTEVEQQAHDRRDAWLQEA